MTLSTTALYWLRRDLVYPQEVIERAARYAFLYLLPHSDAAGPNGLPDLSHVDAIVARLRAVNPRQRIGLYVGGLMYKQEIDPPALWLTDADLLHYAGTANVLRKYDALAITGDYHTYAMPNLTSPAVIDKIVNGYVRLVQEHELDGILLDGFDPDFYALHTRTPYPQGMFGANAGCAEGAMHQPDAWVGPLTAFGDQLRWRLEQIGARFDFNGLHAPWPVDLGTPVGAWNGPSLTSRLDHASGGMAEATSQIYRDSATFHGFIDLARRSVAKRRGVWLSATPWTSQPNDPEVDRFYTAFYLLVQEPPYTSFCYHPYVPFRAWDGHDQPYIHWSADWDLDYGYALAPAAPLGSVAGTSTPVWGRWYRGPLGSCLVLVNPSPAPQLATTGGGGMYREWHPVTGVRVDMDAQAPLYRYWVPPSAARVLWQVAA